MAVGVLLLLVLFALGFALWQSRPAVGVPGRFSTALLMTAGVLVTLTTGLCSLMLIASGDRLFIIGLPLPILGIWMFLHGRRRLRAGNSPASPDAGWQPPTAPAGVEGAVEAAADPDTEDQQILRRRNLNASILFALAGAGVLLTTLIDIMGDSHPTTREVGQWAFRMLFGMGIFGIGLWLVLRTEELPTRLPDNAVRPDDAPASLRSQAPQMATDAPLVPGLERAAVPGAAVGPKWLGIPMILVGGVLVLAGGAFAAIGTPVVIQQLSWGGGPVYEFHRVATLAIAWAVPVFGVVLVRRGWHRLRPRGPWG